MHQTPVPPGRECSILQADVTPIASVPCLLRLAHPGTPLYYTDIQGQGEGRALFFPFSYVGQAKAFGANEARADISWGRR